MANDDFICRKIWSLLHVRNYQCWQWGRNCTHGRSFKMGPHVKLGFKIVKNCIIIASQTIALTKPLL